MTYPEKNVHADFEPQASGLNYPADWTGGLDDIIVPPPAPQDFNPAIKISAAIITGLIVVIVVLCLLAIAFKVASGILS